MLGSAVLELLIGLATIYLMFSVIASALIEAWEARSPRIGGGLRGRMMARAIDRILPRATKSAGSNSDRTDSDETNSDVLLEHPLVSALCEKGKQRPPSYLSATAFSEVVLDLLTQGAGNRSAERLQSLSDQLAPAASELSGGGLQLNAATVDVLRNKLRVATERGGHHAESTLSEFKSELECWYDQAQERAVGWYKRALQKRLFAIAMVLVFATNLDLLQTVRTLYGDAQLRQVVGALQISAESGAAELLGTLQQTGLQLGLPEFSGKSASQLLMMLLGLMASALAVSMGAPFWFDLLSKIVSLRGSGKAIPTHPAPTNPSQLTTTPVAAASLATLGPVMPGMTAGGAATEPAPSIVMPTSVMPSLTATTATPSPLSASQSSVLSGATPTAPSRQSGGMLPALPADYWQQHLQGAASILPTSPQVDAAANAAVMARMANLAYMSLPVVEEMLSSAGARVTTFDHGGTQAFAYEVGTQGPRVLAFRGTEPKRLDDIIADAKFALKERDFNGEELEVHLGFYDALEEVWEQVWGWVQQSGIERELWITGHSLGAALATLASARLQGHGVPTEKLRLFTFGSPRVGSRELAARFQNNDSHEGIAAFRFVNNEDLVTRVPPRQMGYKHVGCIRYFSADGKLSTHMNEWTRFLGTILNAVDDFKAAAKTTVADHNMDIYVQRVDQMQGVEVMTEHA